MSGKPYPVIEFESVIEPDGKIHIPKEILSTLGTGTSVTVRVMKDMIEDSLRRRSVSEEEVERIAVRQLEERKNVITFLNSEGALRSNRSFRRRAIRLLNR